MHVTDDRLLDVPDEVLDALNGADIVALENLDVLDKVTTRQRLKEIPELWKFQDGKSLRDYMTEQELETLLIGLARRPIQRRDMAGGKSAAEPIRAGRQRGDRAVQ